MTWRSTILAVLAAGWLGAHFSWITPVPPRPAVGQTVELAIGDGHVFPASEAPLASAGLEVFAVTPSGRRVPLNTSPGAKSLAAEYTISEAGLHRFAFVQDRGLLSRTPKGVLRGGRDRNPNAARVIKSYKSAIAYAVTPGTSLPEVKPLGLEFEAVPRVTGDRVMLTVYRSGKPFPGAQINLGALNQKEAELGKSGAGGTFSYTVPAGQRGQPFLLIVEYSGKGPAGAPYDSESYASVLCLTVP